MSRDCVSPDVASDAATVRPSRMTVTRSLMANTSSSRCETKTSPCPAWRNRVITSNRRSTSVGLSEAVGSSKMMSVASSASALAISTSWRCAAERRRTSCSSGRVSCWPRLARMASARCRRAPRRNRPGQAELGQEDVLENGKVGREAGLLHHHCDAGADRLARVARIERRAAEFDAAAVAADMAADHARQGGLPGAVRTEQRMHLAGGDLERGAGQRAGLAECASRPPARAGAGPAGAPPASVAIR